MPDLNPVYRDEYLTNMLVGYTGGKRRIGDKLMPRFAVPGRRGYYLKSDKEKFRIDENLVARRAATPEVSHELSKAPFGPLTKRGLKEFIDEEDIETYGSEDKARAAAAKVIAGKMMLAHEKEVSDLLTDPTVITNGVVLGSGEKFSDYSVDPIGVIDTGLETIKQKAWTEANTIAMGWKTWLKIRRHPDLLGLLNVASLRRLTPEMFADIIGVENVLISDIQYNTAKKGQADSDGAFVWGNDILLAYVNPNQELMDEVTLGRTLYQEGKAFIDSWNVTDPDGTYIRSHDFYDVMMVDGNCGYLIEDAI